MKLYVYRVSDHEYGAGLGRIECERRGKIVEEWPLNTVEQAAFLQGHGTAFKGAAEQVSRISDLVRALLMIDQTFVPPADVEPERFIAQIVEQINPPRPKFSQRMKQWFFGQSPTAQ